MNLTKYNKISITKESLENLLEWRDKHKDLVRKFRPILDEGVISLDNMSYVVFERIDEDIFKLTMLSILIANKPILSFFLHCNTGLLIKEFRHNQIIDKILADSPPGSDEYQDVVTVFASLMAYMENFQPEKEYVQTSVERIHKKQGTKKGGKKSSVVTLRKVIKVYVPNNLPSPKHKRSYERKTESWEVRGFWRHYKSGKSVYVKGFNKGKGQSKPKEYKVEI